MIRWCAISFLLMGCTSLRPTGSNRFVVEKMWVRNTLIKEDLGPRLVHRFQPIITDELIIQGNSKDSVVAYARVGLFERWRMQIKDGVEGGAEAVGDSLYFGASDGFFYSVDLRNGHIQWTFPTNAEGLSAPTVVNGTVYFLAGNNVAHALDAQTGKLKWVYTRRDTTNLSIRGGSRPAVAGDFVYIGFSDGFLVALDKNNGSVKWEAPINRNKRFRDVDAEPIIDKERIFITSYDGALYAINRADGRIQWSVDDGGYSAVTLSGNRLYYSTSSGKTVAIDKESGKILWSSENPSGIATRPVLFRDSLIVGQMQGAILFLDPRTGKKLNEFDSGWGVTSTPTPDPDKSEIYFMTAGANLYALKVGWEKSGSQWPWER